MPFTLLKASFLGKKNNTNVPYKLNKQFNYITLYYKTNTKMFRNTSLLLHKALFLELAFYVFYNNCTTFNLCNNTNTLNNTI